MHYKKRPRVDDEPRLLPLDYHIGEDTVMIGRGRRCFNNEGNRRFRAMVKAELRVYSAGRKGTKSTIIKRILRHIRSSCPDGIGFIKQDALSGRYYTATESAAKVTIAQQFRDALHDLGYKSSKQHKQFKRDIATGKIDPGDPRAVCSTCMDEIKAIEDGGLVPPQQLAVENSFKPKEESSLAFWENTVELPDINDDNEHIMQAHTHEHGFDLEHEQDHEQLPKLELKNRVFTSVKEPAKTIDPFEPIPFSLSMVDLEGIKGVDDLLAPHQGNKATDTSESSGDVEEMTDDEEDAMVAWSGEFVHCPRCSVIEGKHKFEPLPIQDIREALIG